MTVCTTGRQIGSLVAQVGGVETWNLICFGMVSLGLVLSICGMATQSDAGPEHFRSYLGQVAGYHFALVSRLKSFSPQRMIQLLVLRHCFESVSSLLPHAHSSCSSLQIFLIGQLSF